MGSIGYAPLGDRRDESAGPDGSVRPQWEELFESIERHGSTVVSTWRTAASRISRERGLAYRPAQADGLSGEGWTLDPVPWILGDEQWTGLAKGIDQRIRLYGELLRDAYGKQRILHEKVVPAEILLGHGGFVRALHDLTPGEGIIGLGISAFDVAHDNSGRPFVVNDRFDCPFGLGLALENRTVVNQVLPRLFRRCGVRRIGQFFTQWFDFLHRQAAHRSERPLIVILDASADEEDSEIGFLANYCGVLRVHPSDLTVRSGRVWIRALRGLVPVDVIWKTSPGKTIDSLEAEIRGQIGVAGLFEAMRVDGVSLASHPGAEVLQSPGFYPYLPRLCRMFLDEDLHVPPVASWWCGDETALSHVLANLPRMVIKSVGHHRDFRTVYGSRLDAEGLAELEARLRANPKAFVGQEELMISTVPATRSESLAPRSSVMRTFAFLDNERGAQVMPGGLARVSTAEGFVISTRNTGVSKDVWVRSPSEPQPYSISSALERSLPTAPDIVPSRSGENLFWTGRYAERAHLAAKFATRIIDGRNRGFSHDSEFEARHEELLLHGLFGEVFDCESWLESASDNDARLDLILRDRGCPAGIAFHLERLRFSTHFTKESWSPASILAIENCIEGWSLAIDRVSPSSLHERFHSDLDALQMHLSAFLGLNLDSMTRDEAWALLDAGRRIERGGIHCCLLRFLLEADCEEDMRSLLSESMLFILDSVRTYQRRYQAPPERARVVELLMGERLYPRSLLQILVRLREDIGMLPPPSKGEHPSTRLDEAIVGLEQFVLGVTGQVEADLFDVDEAVAKLSELETLFASVSDHLTVSYFSHAAEG